MAAPTATRALAPMDGTGSDGVGPADDTGYGPGGGLSV